MSRARTLACLASLSRATPAFAGKARVQRLATRLFAGDGTVATEVDGVTWHLDPGELIQQRILWDGLHDGHVVAWLVRQAAGREAAGALGVRTTLWDVGANVGAIALPTAARVATVQVEAFEPAPGPRTRLEVNVAANRSHGGPGERIRVHALALSHATGTASFFESAERANAGLGTLYAASNTRAAATILATVRGDDLVATGRAAPPDVIKIDVEGFEREVLDGLAQTIAQRRPLLCVESAGYRLAERGLAPDTIVIALERLGYRVAVIAARGEERPLVPSDLTGNVDLAAHPR